MKTLLCLAAATIALSGCGDLDRNPLWLAVFVDKTTVAMDDSVRVSLSIANTGNREVMVYPASAYGPCLPAFEVFDSRGNAVEMDVVCAASMSLPPQVPLAPGEQLDITAWWLPGISRINGTAITAGAYLLQGAIRGNDRMVRTDAFEIAVVE